MRHLGLCLIAVPAWIAGCTFPDVDYADGGSGSCPGLDPCTVAATSCKTAMEAQHSTCIAGCHSSACATKCDETLVSDLSTCAATCTSCAPSSCTGAAAACQQAAGS
jgi:hypothetical protein